MTKRFERFAAAAMASTLCAGLLAATAPPAGGSISIETGTTDGNSARAVPMFVDAASEALAARGFTILDDPGHSAYVAELSLGRVEVGTGSTKIAAGRGTVAPGAYGGVGAGVTIPLSTGNSEIVPLERTQLDVRIRRRGEDAVVWHGAAVTVRAAGTKQGADEVIAADLTRAVLRGYPVEPQGVVGVP